MSTSPQEPLTGEPAAQAHHAQPQLASEPGIGAGDDGSCGHIVSITHYPR